MSLEPFEHGGQYYLSFRGGAAEDWAQLARSANRVVQLSLTYDRATLYNVVDFPAKGSTAALKQVLDACG